MELKLLQVREATGELVSSPDAIAEAMKEESKADRECFWVLHLNTKNQIIEKELVAMGVLDAAYIHPREVFRKAVINSSYCIATVHNHPSGHPEPSEADRKVWNMLRESGKILQIEVVDNLVISPSGRFYSQKRDGISV